MERFKEGDKAWCFLCGSEYVDLSKLTLDFDIVDLEPLENSLDDYADAFTSKREALQALAARLKELLDDEEK